MKVMEVDNTIDSGVSYYDGLVGLSVEAKGRAGLLVDELFDEGHIDERIFSVYYTTETNNNHIYFGGHSEEHKTEEFEYIDLVSTASHWTLPASKAAYGDITIAYTLKYGILDSGTSLMYFPMSSF